MAAPFFVNIGDVRIKYKDPDEAFMESHLVSKEPLGQFKAWFEEARADPRTIEPNAMCLATADRNGAPSARFVLLKSFGTEGFKFFTNCGSRKGKDLEENPQAALTFYWSHLNRQIRIEGKAERLPDAEATAYFESRPYCSQVGAAASDQSAVVPSREFLIERSRELMELHPGDKVPKPLAWGGFVVVPDRVEFWQGQSDRLHDRIVFRRPDPGEAINPDIQHQGDQGWLYERLAP